MKLNELRSGMLIKTMDDRVAVVFSGIAPVDKPYGEFYYDVAVFTDKGTFIDLEGYNDDMTNGIFTIMEVCSPDISDMCLHIWDPDKVIWKREPEEEEPTMADVIKRLDKLETSVDWLKDWVRRND